jgi:hypothetical protein
MTPTTHTARTTPGSKSLVVLGVTNVVLRVTSRLLDPEAHARHGRRVPSRIDRLHIKHVAPGTKSWGLERARARDEFSTVDPADKAAGLAGGEAELGALVRNRFCRPLHDRDGGGGRIRRRDWRRWRAFCWWCAGPARIHGKLKSADSWAGLPQRHRGHQEHDARRDQQDGWSAVWPSAALPSVCVLLHEATTL